MSRRIKLAIKLSDEDYELCRQLAVTVIHRILDEKTRKEPKMGRWIPVTNGRGGSECSQCHSYAPSHQSGVENKSNYCPNCGARMEGVEDGTRN